MPTTTNSNDEFWLKNGLIKTDEKTDLIGYKSGKRSALVQCQLTKKFLRLKGCGNELSGFITSKGRVNLDENSKEIRGSHFQHTVRRELFMTNKINEILKNYDLISGNKSLGFWKYNNLINNNINNDFPLIPKYCGVFETLGEKRVASHFFQGIEIFLTGIINEIGIEINIRDIFPKDRIINFDDNDEKLDVYSTPIDFEEVLLKNIKAEIYYTEDDYKKYINIFDVIEKKKVLINLNNKMKDIMLELFEKLNLDKKYFELYKNYIEIIFKKEDFSDLFEIISLLYYRIGYECGKIKKIFIKNDINWGYYIDHHPFLSHCNAHPNNFIILPQSISKNLIAPLDFDLAYEAKEGLNIDYNSEKYGKLDKEFFEDSQKLEKFQFELALTGIENMENFEYYKNSIKISEIYLEKKFNAIKVLLRDGLRKGYMEGYNFKNCLEKNYKSDQMYSIVNIALIITNDYLA